MKRIQSIKIVKIPDSISTPDYLGTYDYVARPAEMAIDRHERGDMKRGECRYFNPRAGNAQDAESDYRRAEAFNNSDWSFIGVRAVATVETSEDGKTWLSNQLGSAGLWGVESDSDEEYLASIGEEERGELTAVLLEFGFSQEEIDRAAAE